MFTTPELTFLKIVLDGRLDRARRTEAGASAIEWVIITAALAAIVGIVFAIIQQKIVDKAGDIDTGAGPLSA